MNWREYFNCHNDSEVIEEMYQAFKERMEAEAHGEILKYTPEEIAEKHDREDEEDNYWKYKKTEHYRKQYAKQKGYKFKPNPYDPDKKYK